VERGAVCVARLGLVQTDILAVIQMDVGIIL